MALRQGGRALARSLMAAKESLPTRGGGGGPIRYAAAPDKPIPLWDELWWDDGLFHSQPVLDGTLEPQVVEPGVAARRLVIALSAIGAVVWGFASAWTEKNETCVPQQYPPEVLETFTSRDKAQWIGRSP